MQLKNPLYADPRSSAYTANSRVLQPITGKFHRVVSRFVRQRLFVARVHYVHTTHHQTTLRTELTPSSRCAYVDLIAFCAELRACQSRIPFFRRVAKSRRSDGGSSVGARRDEPTEYARPANDARVIYGGVCTNRNAESTTEDRTLL